jgi:type V secretory pathway adhesin AidA
MRVRFTSDSSDTYDGFVGNWAVFSSEESTAAGFVGNWVASSEDDDETVAPTTPPRTTPRPIVDPSSGTRYEVGSSTHSSER